jgi:CoA:oxalate CoA-transferase
MTLPLADIVVLDLTRAVSGPYCTLMLKNLGATVIKVEHPGSGDDTRGLGPFQDGISTYNAIFNHGKKSIALDLKAPDDKAIFEKLLKKADILVENFRPGVMERMGYSWENLHKQYSKLIYVAISGYGQSGPISNHACYDLVAQGLSGIMNLTGHSPDQPTKVGTEIADMLAGIHAAFGTQTALYHRAVTGEGTLVDVAMLDCMLSLLYSAVDRYTATKELPGPIGNRHPTAVPFDTFKTKDRPLNIAVANDNLFSKLCQVLEKPELATDKRFQTIAARTENRVALTEIIQEILLKKKSTEWLEELVAAGIPAGRIYDLHETLNFPQLLHRNMVAKFEEGYLPEVRFPGNPIKLSCMEDTSVFEKAPELNENRDDILNFIQTGQWSKKDKKA